MGAAATRAYCTTCADEELRLETRDDERVQGQNPGQLVPSFPDAVKHHRRPPSSPVFGMEGGSSYNGSQLTGFSANAVQVTYSDAAYVQPDFYEQSPEASLDAVTHPPVNSDPKQGLHVSFQLDETAPVQQPSGGPTVADPVQPAVSSPPRGNYMDIYGGGQLLWTEAVPAEKTGNSAFHPLEQPRPDEKWICFLNEPRVLFTKFVYKNYPISHYHDSGPPTLDQIVEGCRLLEDALRTARTVVVFCPEGPAYDVTRRFSSLCLAAHAVLVRKESAADTAQKWRNTFRSPQSSTLDFPAHSFAPAKEPPPPNTLLFEDCLSALEFAHYKGWFSVDTFDVNAYRQLAQIFDATVLVPGDIMVLADPMSTILDPDPETATSLVLKEGEDASESRSFAVLFKLCSVILLVRVNQTKEPGLIQSYRPQELKGYTEHLDLDVIDVVPKGQIIRKIVGKVDLLRQKQAGAVAIHCKSGFGRSIVCAVVMIVHRYGIRGRIASAWARMCRPGCVNHPEQAELLAGLDAEKAEELLKGSKRAGGGGMFGLFGKK